MEAKDFTAEPRALAAEDETDAIKDIRFSFLRFQNISKCVFAREFEIIVKFCTAKGLMPAILQLTTIPQPAECVVTRESFKWLYAVVYQRAFRQAAMAYLALVHITVTMKTHVRLLPFSIVGTVNMKNSKKWAFNEQSISTTTICRNYFANRENYRELWTLEVLRQQIQDFNAAAAELTSVMTLLKQMEGNFSEAKQDKIHGFFFPQLPVLQLANLSKPAFSQMAAHLVQKDVNVIEQFFKARFDVTDECRRTFLASVNTAGVQLQTWDKITTGIVPKKMINATRNIVNKDQWIASPFNHRSYHAMCAKYPEALQACTKLTESIPNVNNETKCDTFLKAFTAWANEAFPIDFEAFVEGMKLDSGNFKIATRVWVSATVAFNATCNDATGPVDAPESDSKDDITKEKPGLKNSPAKVAGLAQLAKEIEGAHSEQGKIDMTDLKVFIEAILAREEDEKFLEIHADELGWFQTSVGPAIETLQRTLDALKKVPHALSAIHLIGTGPMTTAQLETTSDASMYWPVQLYSLDQIYAHLIRVGVEYAVAFRDLVAGYVKDLNRCVKRNVVHEVFWASAMFTSSSASPKDAADAYYTDKQLRARDDPLNFTYQTLCAFGIAQDLNQSAEMLTKFCEFTVDMIARRQRLAQQCQNAFAHINSGPRERNGVKNTSDDFWFDIGMNFVTEWGDEPFPIHMSHRQDLARYCSIIACYVDYFNTENLFIASDMWEEDVVRNLAVLRGLEPPDIPEYISLKYRECSMETLKTLAEKCQSPAFESSKYPQTVDAIRVLPKRVTDDIPFHFIETGARASFNDIVRMAVLRQSTKSLDNACNTVYKCVESLSEDSIRKTLAASFADTSNASVNAFDKFCLRHRKVDDIAELTRLSHECIKAVKLPTVKFSPTHRRALEKSYRKLCKTKFEFSALAKSKTAPPQTRNPVSASLPSPEVDAPADVEIVAAPAAGSRNDASVWTYDRRTLTTSKSATVPITLPNVKFVSSHSLLTLSPVRDASIAYEEARLVTGDGSGADALNHSLLVQIVTMLLAYIPDASVKFAAASGNDANLDAIVHYIDNRLQMKPASDMAMWTAASNVTYTRDRNSIHLLLSSLLGPDSREQLPCQLLEVPYTVGESWTKQLLASQSINDLFQIKNATPGYAIVIFKTWRDDPHFKPTLEDMRAITGHLYTRNTKTTQQHLTPLCYVYTMHVKGKEAPTTFRIIDSAHQIREQMQTRVHMMLVATESKFANNVHRTLGDMPVRVCPLCGLVRSANSMTLENFQNHMYASRYQCAVVKFFSANPAPTPYYCTELAHLKLPDKYAEVFVQFMKTPVWSRAVETLYTDQAKLNPGKLASLVDELVDTLTPPLVRGTNAFFTALERKCGLTHAFYAHVPKVVEKLMEPFTRLLRVLRKKPAEIAKWAIPRLMQYHSGKSGVPVGKDVSYRAGYIRARVWNEFCNLAIQMLLLNLPPSCFAGALPRHGDGSSVAETLWRASNRPSEECRNYYRNEQNCRVDERTSLASCAMTRDNVMTTKQQRADAKAASAKEKKRAAQEKAKDEKRAARVRDKAAAATAAASKKAKSVAQPGVGAAAAAAVDEDPDVAEDDDDDDDTGEAKDDDDEEANAGGPQPIVVHAGPAVAASTHSPVAVSDPDWENQPSARLTIEALDKLMIQGTAFDGSLLDDANIENFSIITSDTPSDDIAISVQGLFFQ